MKPNLSDVTICSADCVMPHLALIAIEKSLLQCDFAKAILFTDKLIRHKKEIELIRIKKLNSVNDYSRFILKETMAIFLTCSTPNAPINSKHGMSVSPLIVTDFIFRKSL